MCCYGKGDYSIRMLFWGLKVRRGQHSFYDCSWLFNMRSIQMHFSTDSIYSTKSILQFFVPYVKTLTFKIWLRDEFNLKWTGNQMFRSQCLWCVTQLPRALTSVFVSASFADKSTHGLQHSIYTDPSTANPEDIQPLLLALPLSFLQGLSHLRLQSALSSTLSGLFVFRLPGAGRKKGLSELPKILVIFTWRLRHC